MDRYDVPNKIAHMTRALDVLKVETCCKLDAVIAALGGGGETTNVVPGLLRLTGTASFDTASGNYRSVSMSVISLTTGTVTVDTGTGPTDVSYPGYSTGWGIDKNTDLFLEDNLTIATTGDAVVIISYTTV